MEEDINAVLGQLLAGDMEYEDAVRELLELFQQSGKE